MADHCPSTASTSDEARRPRWTVFATVFAGILVGIPRSVSAQYVTFAFDPPAPLRIDEYYRLTTEVFMGVGEPEKEITSHRNRYDLRRTSSGYSVRATPMSEAELTEYGTNLVAAMLSKAQITYDLDHQGQLIGVRGADEAFNELRESLSPQMVAVLMSALGQADRSPAQLVADNWTQRGMLGHMVGRRVLIDSVYSASTAVPLPVGGSALADLQVVFQRGECAGGECVKAFTMYHSTDQSVADRLTAAMRSLVVGMGDALLQLLRDNPELRRALEEEEGAEIDTSTDISELVPYFSFSNAVFTSENLRTIDPRTGLLYSEIESQTLAGDFALAGEAATWVEIKRLTSWDYEFQQ